MKLLLPFVFALACFGQKLHVYSPLTRVDPSGAIVKPDRGSAEPRHILSPGVPRNAWSSFRVVVEVDKPELFQLDIAQNPDNAVEARLYRESFAETDSGFVPDALEPVKIPYRGGPQDFRMPHQRFVSFWLDIRVPRDAEVDRIKVEPQLYLESIQDWVVYPMEVRIQQPVVPNMTETFATERPELTAPSDAAVRGPLRAALCGKAEKIGERPSQLTGRDLIRRNVLQHLKLIPAGELTLLFTRFSGSTDIKRWCESPSTPAAGPEWYLRLRDGIYRRAGAGD